MSPSTQEKHCDSIVQNVVAIFVHPYLPRQDSEPSQRMDYCRWSSAGERRELFGNPLFATLGTGEIIGPFSHALEDFESLATVEALILVDRHNGNCNAVRSTDIPPAMFSTAAPFC